MMGDKKEWFGWLDFAKVVGIFLMILGHQRLVDERTTFWIFSFHMPLFFFISGITSKKESFICLFKKGVRSLLIPFCIISVIWILYYLACYIKRGSVDWTAWIGKSWKSIVYPYEGYCIYLWFLLALFWCKLMSYSIFCHRIFRWGFVGLSFFISLLIIHYNLHIPFSITQAFLSYPFFFVGSLLSKQIKNEKRFYIWGPVFLASAIIMFFSLINGRVSIADLLYGDSLVLFLLFGVTGSLLIISFGKLIEMISPILVRNRLIEVFASGTLLIVGFSAMLTGYVKTVFARVLDIGLISHSNFGFLIGLLVFFFFHPLILICKRWFPAILGFRSRNER